MPNTIWNVSTGHNLTNAETKSHHINNLLMTGWTERLTTWGAAINEKVVNMMTFLVSLCVILQVHDDTMTWTTLLALLTLCVGNPLSGFPSQRVCNA